VTKGARRALVLALGAGALALSARTLQTRMLESMLFFPSNAIDTTPREHGLEFEALRVTTEDGIALGAWWIPTQTRPVRGHVLHCHGNAGNIATRISAASMLGSAGFDVLLFDYRGYGTSGGKPTEAGTARDARAALAALRARPGLDPSRIFYLGESLGGAVALELALREPPRGLILQASFTSVRDMARVHYPLLSLIAPDAYPSLRRIAGLRAPLLVVHGDQDEIVPLAQGQALFRAAREPKRLEVLKGAGHNDLVAHSGDAYARLLAEWAASLPAG
jgi:fermentation-respiration switch protein FrsA (DUF1100 family)